MMPEPGIFMLRGNDCDVKLCPSAGDSSGCKKQKHNIRDKDQSEAEQQDNRGC